MEQRRCMRRPTFTQDERDIPPGGARVSVLSSNYEPVTEGPLWLGIYLWAAVGASRR